MTATCVVREANGKPAIQGHVSSRGMTEAARRGQSRAVRSVLLSSKDVRAAFCSKCWRVKRHVKGRCECGKTRDVSEAQAREESNHPDGLEIKFFDRIEQTPYCWNWIGTFTNNEKTPDMRCYGVRVFAKKLSWFYATGCWQREWLWRLCHNNRCVNPDHLGEGPRSVGRQIRADRFTRFGPTRRSHCKRGHLMTDENRMFVGPNFACRRCRKVYERRYRARRTHLSRLKAASI